MNIVELGDQGGLRALDNHEISIAESEVGNMSVFLDNSQISLSAEFRGEPITIGENIRINRDAVIELGAVIGNQVLIESGVYLGTGVRLFDGAILNHHSYVGEQSVIGLSATLMPEVIIGSEVSIPHEAQIGEYEVIPSTDTIVCLGRFGTSNRIVTIHGSDNGPRFSIGCQNSVAWETIRDRILHNVETKPESAAHYRTYMPVFKEIGKTVQSKYDRLSRLVDELKEANSGAV